MKKVCLVFVFVIFLTSCLSYSPDIKTGTIKNQDVWTHYLTRTDKYSTSVKLIDEYAEIKLHLKRNEIPKNTRTSKYVKYGNGCFVISRKTDRVYKFNNQPFQTPMELIDVSYYDFVEQSFKFATGSYFNINGSAVKYNIATSDKSVEVHDYGKYHDYVFNQAGIITFDVTLGELNETITIEVIELPFPKNSSIDTLIETFGFPDRKEIGGVRWPDSRWVFGFYYTPKAGYPIHKEFLFYKEFPYLVLSSSNNLVDGVSFIPKISL